MPCAAMAHSPKYEYLELISNISNINSEQSILLVFTDNSVHKNCIVFSLLKIMKNGLAITQDNPWTIFNVKAC
jgi:hypothetical protein